MTYHLNVAGWLLRLYALAALVAAVLLSLHVVTGDLEASGSSLEWRDLLVLVLLDVLAIVGAIGLEFVRRGLMERKPWAWPVSLGIFASTLPSWPTAIPSGVGLWALIRARWSRDEREQCQGHCEP